MVKEIRKIYAVKVWKMVDFFAWKLTKLQGDNFWRRKALKAGETIFEKQIFLGPTFSVAKNENLSQNVALRWRYLLFW